MLPLSFAIPPAKALLSKGRTAGFRQFSLTLGEWCLSRFVRGICGGKNNVLGKMYWLRIVKNALERHLAPTELARGERLPFVDPNEMRESMYLVGSQIVP